MRAQLDHDQAHSRHTPHVSSFRLGSDLDGVSATAKRVSAQPGTQRLLMVGTLEPRKCHRQVVDAVRLLIERGVDVELVVVGREGWLVDDVASDLRRHNDEPDTRLRWIERATDDQLDELYRTSSGLVLASAAEGFGLPIVEAAHHGLPLMLRDLAVFREVAGHHAAYFRGDRPEELADALQAWLGELALGRAPSSAELPRLTWAESTRELLSAVCDELS